MLLKLWFIFLMIGMASDEMQTIKPVAGGFSFPEGPAWHARKGILYVSNCYGNWLASYSNARVDTFVLRPTYPFAFQATNGLVAARDGYLYACDFKAGAIVRFDEKGRCYVYADKFNKTRFNRPNDLAFDQEGNLYFTDPKSYDPENRDGTIYFVSRQTGKVAKKADNLAYPNGIALSADGNYLYVCESAMQRILRFPIQSDYSLTEYTVFAVLPGGDPDGIAFDEAGNLYVAHFGSGTVFILDHAGEIVSQIKLPGMKPTNVEFADNDLQTLYITEAEQNVLYKMTVKTPGLRLLYSY